MIYSEQRPDTDLLNDLEGEKRVFLVGCPACANMSLYIKKAAEGSPVMTITPTGFKAVSMTEEVGRLSQLFAGKGLEVDSWVGKYPICPILIWRGENEHSHCYRNNSSNHDSKYLTVSGGDGDSEPDPLQEREVCIQGYPWVGILYNAASIN